MCTRIRTHTLAHILPANRCQFRSNPCHTHRHPHPRPQQQQKTGENVTQKSIIFRYERKRVKTAIREHFSIFRTRTPITHKPLHTLTHQSHVHMCCSVYNRSVKLKTLYSIVYIYMRYIMNPLSSFANTFWGTHTHNTNNTNATPKRPFRHGHGRGATASSTKLVKYFA